jgi:hypothetical protein
MVNPGAPRRKGKGQRSPGKSPVKKKRSKLNSKESSPVSDAEAEIRNLPTNSNLLSIMNGDPTTDDADVVMQSVARFSLTISRKKITKKWSQLLSAVKSSAKGYTHSDRFKEDGEGIHDEVHHAQRQYFICWGLSTDLATKNPLPVKNWLNLFYGVLGDPKNLIGKTRLSATNIERKKIQQVLANLSCTDPHECFPEMIDE